MDGSGVAYGTGANVGRNSSRSRSQRPAAMSPPTLFGFRASTPAGGVTARARIRSPKPGANRSICASMAAVWSRGQPFGTWQYAQKTCDPAGARPGSDTLGWAVMRKGRPGAEPRWTERSAAPISARDGPTCTVPARRQASAVHGTGPLSA